MNIEDEIEFCREAPKGWKCQRAVGHEGSCAALPIGGDVEVLLPIGKIFDEKYNSVMFYRGTGDQTKRYHQPGTEFVAHDTAMELVTRLQADLQTWKETAETFEDFYRKTEVERDALKKTTDAIDAHLRGRVTDPDPLSPIMPGALSIPTTYGLVAAIRRERDALNAEVDRQTDMKEKNFGVILDQQQKIRDLQSELTKARENIAEAVGYAKLYLGTDAAWARYGTDRDYIEADLNAMLAHQSAPAAKGGE